MDYPTDKDLSLIRNWDNIQNPKGWFDLIHDLWDNPEFGWKVENSGRHTIYRISTGGWSGNEDIIEAMSESIMWPFTWEQSKRGGHFVFMVMKK